MWEKKVCFKKFYMEIFMKNALYACYMTLFFSFQAFHAEAAKTTESYLFNRIDLSDKKYPTFFSVLELLKEAKAKVIVETQTSGNFAEEGESTIIFADWASQNGASFYSIGSSQSDVQVAKNSTLVFGTKIFVVCDDAIAFMRKFDKMIDFLYLNSSDYASGNLQASQAHYLKEIVAAYPKFHEDSIVMVEDTSADGVGNHALNFLIAKGWVILQSGYQVILVPDKDHL